METSNILTRAQWATLESQGVAFLPVTANRQFYGNATLHDIDKGFYWTSSYRDAHTAYDFYFQPGYVYVGWGRRFVGRAVRLAKNVPPPTPIPVP